MFSLFRAFYKPEAYNVRSQDKALVALLERMKDSFDIDGPSRGLSVFTGEELRSVLQGVYFFCLCGFEGWCCGVAVLLWWFCGVVVLCCCSVMVLWCCVVLWCCGLWSVVVCGLWSVVCGGLFRVVYSVLPFVFESAH